jgi:hypothetical protein
LNIGGSRPPDIRAFIPLYAEPFKGIVEVLYKSLVKAGAVGILKAEEEFPSPGLCEEIVKKGGPDSPMCCKPVGEGA